MAYCFIYVKKRYSMDLDYSSFIGGSIHYSFTAHNLVDTSNSLSDALLASAIEGLVDGNNSICLTISKVGGIAHGENILKTPINSFYRSPTMSSVSTSNNNIQFTEVATSNIAGFVHQSLNSHTPLSFSDSSPSNSDTTDTTHTTPTPSPTHKWFLPIGSISYENIPDQKLTFNLKNGFNGSLNVGTPIFNADGVVFSGNINYNTLGCIISLALSSPTYLSQMIQQISIPFSKFSDLQGGVQSFSDLASPNLLVTNYPEHNVNNQSTNVLKLLSASGIRENTQLTLAGLDAQTLAEIIYPYLVFGEEPQIFSFISTKGLNVCLISLNVLGGMSGMYLLNLLMSSSSSSSSPLSSFQFQQKSSIDISSELDRLISNLN